MTLLDVYAQAVACLSTTASAGELSSMLLQSRVCDDIGKCGADEQEDMGMGSGAGEANILERSLHSALKLQAKSSKHAEYSACRSYLPMLSYPCEWNHEIQSFVQLTNKELQSSDMCAMAVHTTEGDRYIMHVSLVFSCEPGSRNYEVS
jgi:hypothetical protein